MIFELSIMFGIPLLVAFAMLVPKPKRLIEKLQKEKTQRMLENLFRD